MFAGNEKMEKFCMQIYKNIFKGIMCWWNWSGFLFEVIWKIFKFHGMEASLWQ